eukprot:1142522-Pelagomonas_calceolata.AAC.6
MDIFCAVGTVEQAKQPNYLAEAIAAFIGSNKATNENKQQELTFSNAQCTCFERKKFQSERTPMDLPKTARPLPINEHDNKQGKVRPRSTLQTMLHCQLTPR